MICIWFEAAALTIVAAVFPAARRDGFVDVAGIFARLNEYRFEIVWLVRTGRRFF
jgi:hypothetical protein